MPDDSVLYYYNAQGQRVFKKYIHHYWGECGGGEGSDAGGEGDFSAGGQSDGGGVWPPPDTLCKKRDTTVVKYIRVKGRVYAEYGHWAFECRAKYVYAGSRRIAMVDQSGAVHFYLSDHLGSTNRVVRADGVLEDGHFYTPYGGIVNEQVVTNQKYRYTVNHLTMMVGLTYTTTELGTMIRLCVGL